MATKTKAAGKAEPARPGRASGRGGHNGCAIGAVAKETVPESKFGEAARGTDRPTEFAADQQPVMIRTPGELVQMIEDLHPRIKELESELAGRVRPGAGGRVDHAEAIDDATSIIATIRDLQRQNDVSYRLKESLEAELAEARHKLTEEQSARAELEARVETLKAKANRAGRLEEEFVSLEREQTQTARRLREVTSQLKLISEERDRLAEQKAGDERQIGELERSVLDFKSKVSRLGETAAELGRLRRELSDTTNALAVATEESQRLKENVQSLKGKLDATDIAKNTLELELATTRELVYGQNEQIDELTGGLEAARAELATARAALTRQEVDIKNLVQSNERAGREMKTLKARIESLQEELDLNTQALREIRTATLRTTARVLEQGPGA